MQKGLTIVLLLIIGSAGCITLETVKTGYEVWSDLNEEFKEIPAEPAPEDPTLDPEDKHIVTENERQGFLWKPVSESDGNVVIIFPHKDVDFDNLGRVEINGKKIWIRAPGIYDKETKTIKPTRTYPNGNGVHARGSKPGSAYGHNVSIKAFDRHGELIKEYVVPDGSKRYPS